MPTKPTLRTTMEETLAGIDHILTMLETYKGSATFESPQSKREFALGAGFVTGAALNAKSQLETFLADPTWGVNDAPLQG